MKVGDGHEITKKMTEEDLNKFVEISGDDNPLHLDEAFAKRTIFKGRVVHGLIPFSLVSQGLTRMMGPGNIWLSQTVKFTFPVRIGDTITVKLKVRDIDNRGVHFIETKGFNQSGKLVFEGEAQSKLLPIKKE